MLSKDALDGGRRDSMPFAGPAQALAILTVLLYTVIPATTSSAIAATTAVGGGRPRPASGGQIRQSVSASNSGTTEPCAAPPGYGHDENDAGHYNCNPASVCSLLDCSAIVSRFSLRNPVRARLTSMGLLWGLSLLATLCDPAPVTSTTPALVVHFLNFQTDKDRRRDSCCSFHSRFSFHSLRWVIGSGDHTLEPMAC